jgi:hypothetical protein
LTVEVEKLLERMRWRSREGQRPVSGQNWLTSFSAKKGKKNCGSGLELLESRMVGTSSARTVLQILSVGHRENALKFRVWTRGGPLGVSLFLTKGTGATNARKPNEEGAPSPKFRPWSQILLSPEGKQISNSTSTLQKKKRKDRPSASPGLVNCAECRPIVRISHASRTPPEAKAVTSSSVSNPSPRLCTVHLKLLHGVLKLLLNDLNVMS